MIYGGSSGYSFREWVGRFYPPKTSAKDFLRYYARELPSVEINHTFRRFPKLDLIQGWAQATPERFRFSFKMHQSVTHRARLKSVSDSVRDFLDALVPLGPRLGVVLFQLPPHFKCDLERLDVFLENLPGGYRYAMEFRHESWDQASVTERLKGAGIALCSAEVEIDESNVKTTAPFAYLRFRKTPPYNDEEISRAGRLVRRVAEGVEDVYFYVKHDDEGQAPEIVKRIAGGNEAT
jgi:uncharacterized protein YecE (DUF72 family)